MNSKSNLLFWIEACLAAVSSLLFIVTVLWHNWIEVVFKLDLDAGSGALEGLSVLGTGAVAVGLTLLTAGNWRRMRRLKLECRTGIPRGV